VKRLSLICAFFVLSITPGCFTPPRVEGPSPAVYDETERAKDLYALGVIAYDSGNYENALEYLDQAVLLWPAGDRGGADVLLKRAHVYTALGRYDLAAADIGEVIIRFPNMPEAYYERALLSYRRGQDGRAEADLDLVLSLDITYARAYNLWGVIYASRGEFMNALDAYDSAIAYDDSYAPFYFNRAKTMVDMGDYASAVSDYTNAIMRYSEDQVKYQAQAYCMRAEAFLMMGNVKMAEKDRAKAHSLFPDICTGKEDEKPGWGKGDISE
jgi:tetratricopeptide (TPR) repeat protein